MSLRINSHPLTWLLIIGGNSTVNYRANLYVVHVAWFG